MIEAELIDYMGTDLTVVNAARVSFDKRHTEFNNISDKKLINFLARMGHWTPFSHPQITIRVKAPIFVRAQCFKHKQGFTENEISRRYIDTKPEFFFPVLRARAEEKKQGSRNEFPEALEECERLIRIMHEASSAVYEALINLKVSPEQARMILPLSTMTEWYWTGSLAAYARFYMLRTTPEAQAETEQLALMIGDIIGPLFPVSWEALIS